MDAESLWYINDEVGSAINHSDNPNFKITPFLYMPNNVMDKDMISFSLMWPIKDIKLEEVITRDYLYEISEEK